MKNRVYVTGLMVCLMVIFFSFGSSYAQDSRYLKMDYIEVQSNQVSQFLQLMENVWKPLQSQGIESGEIMDWYLYEVTYAGGKRRNYNFVTVTVINSLDQLEKLNSPSENKAEVSDEQMQETIAVREILYSEIWKVENSIRDSDNNSAPPRYLVMDYMNVKPGKDFDYLMLEEDVAKPIHQERMNQNVMRGWEVYSLIIPGGTNYGYNFATGNFFDNLSHIEFGFTEEVVKQALPGTNLPELFNLIFETRDMVNHEMWEMIASAD